MDDNNPQQAVQAQAPTGGGPDSGVETEGDQESNDSSLSSVSIGGPLPQAQAQPVMSNSGINENFQVPLAASGSSSNAAVPTTSRNTPEPLKSFLHPNSLQPPPSVTEDGYLGDCSSDGGNEKNFPMPSHLLKRLVNGKTCPCHPESKSDCNTDCNSNPSDSEAPDPPAGLSFERLATSPNSFGYQVLPQNFYISGKEFRSQCANMRIFLSLKSCVKLISQFHGVEIPALFCHSYFT